MAIEFTRLADVTAIEEVKDEDTVLVVQDGEVKRAPKTAVGGASAEWDAVIEWDGVNDTFVYVSGDYNAVYNKILVDEEIPNIKIKTYTNYGFDAYGIEKARMITVVINPDDSNDHCIVFERPETCMRTVSSESFIAWRQDNTVELY